MLSSSDSSNFRCVFPRGLSSEPVTLRPRWVGGTNPAEVGGATVGGGAATSLRSDPAASLLSSEAVAVGVIEGTYGFTTTGGTDATDGWEVIGTLRLCEGTIPPAVLLGGGGTV